MKRYELNYQASQKILELLNEGKTISEIFNIISDYSWFSGSISTFRKRINECFEKKKYTCESKWDYRQNCQNSFQIIMDCLDYNNEVYCEQIKYLKDSIIKSNINKANRKVINLTDIIRSKSV